MDRYEILIKKKIASYVHVKYSEKKWNVDQEIDPPTLKGLITYLKGCPDWEETFKKEILKELKWKGNVPKQTIKAGLWQYKLPKVPTMEEWEEMIDTLENDHLNDIFGKIEKKV